MAWVALNCPQCAAPLPRIAIWRSVTCASCGALITKTESIVQRDTFRQALLRARGNGAYSDGDLQCGGERYQFLEILGEGDASQVYLARRIGLLPFLATIKVTSSSAAAARFALEAQILRELHGAQAGAASLYAAQRLPEIVAQGLVNGPGARQALILRYPVGYWGSLAALNSRFPGGIDPRHAVWIWRRLLDVLHFLHAQGWSHGDVRPEHALVQPQDHSVRLISWAAAQKGASESARSTDLMRSARVILVLLRGTRAAGVLSSAAPAPLADLVARASEDAEFCREQGALGLDALLRAVALAAFGPPSFLTLDI